MNFDKVIEIFNAWSIAFDPGAAQADLATKRIQVCNTCEFKGIIGIAPVSIARCNVCGCALKGKIYTKKTYLDEGGSCPQEKWKQVEEDWLINRI